MVSIFLNDQYRDLQEPKFKLDDSKSAEPQFIQEAKFKDSYSTYFKQKNMAELDKVKIYNIIRGNMSVESIERVESNADFTTKKVRDTQDPLDLWRIIKKTHVCGRTGVDLIDEANVQSMYHGLRMRQNETVPEFKLRYERALRSICLISMRPAKQSTSS
jgi:hypothetical protein